MVLREFFDAENLKRDVCRQLARLRIRAQVQDRRIQKKYDLVFPATPPTMPPLPANASPPPSRQKHCYRDAAVVRDMTSALTTAR
jgi:hypothetical protein